MKTVRVFVSKTNLAAVTCPFCEKTNSLSVEKFKGIKHTVVTQCVCQQRFKIELNFRAYHRKTVKIIGEFLNITSGSRNWEIITIIDLSMTGLRIKAIGPTDIQKGHILRVRFSLDNQKAAQIDKEVGVVNISKDTYGCEFLILDYEKELGFYLRS